MITSYTAAPDIEVLTSNFPIPGYGLVPINTFVLKGPEPVLVDTGSGVESDHIGSLHRLLAENPTLRVITTFLGVGIMGLSAPLPLDRVYLLNPGETITVGNRRLTAVKPPAFDNPSTTGFYDDTSRAFFSSDCFGALLSSVPQNAADLSEQDLHDGQVFWATVDSPWLHKVDGDVFARGLDGIRSMAPQMILSSHLPAASGRMMERLLTSLAAARHTQPFVGPNQAALEQMLSEMPAKPV